MVCLTFALCPPARPAKARLFFDRDEGIEELPGESENLGIANVGQPSRVGSFLVSNEEPVKNCETVHSITVVDLSRKFAYTVLSSALHLSDEQSMPRNYNPLNRISIL